MKTKRALIIVDVQKDFMPGGTLAVPNGDEIIPTINKILPKFDLVIFTLDWHPENHNSFASQHEGKKEFDVIDINGNKQVLWPDHCIQDTPGAALHPDINLSLIDGSFYFFKKGINPEIDSYSGFYDNNRNSSELSDFLNEKGVEKVFLVGLAFEYCLAFTAIDAALLGFKTTVIKEGTRPIRLSSFNEVMKKFKDAGVNLIEEWEMSLYNLL